MSAQHGGRTPHLGDAVAAGLHKRGQSRRRNRRSGGVAALVLVDATVPVAPDLGGREHASTTAHVAVRTLARAARTATAHTGDTRDSASSTWRVSGERDMATQGRTPRDGGRLVAGLLGDGVRLALVLAHVGVHERDDVVADGGQEDSGKGNLRRSAHGAAPARP